MKEKVIICAVLLFVLSLITLPIYFFGFMDNTSNRVYASRGTWHGHIYVNEFMDFQFEILPTWFIYTEEELASIHNVGGAMIAERERDFYNQDPPPFYFNDMYTRDFFSGDGVLVASNPISSAVEQKGEIENLQAGMVQLSELSNVFQHFQMGDVPRRLGGNYWYYMTYEVFPSGIQMYLINFYDGFRRAITVTSDSLKGIEDILNIFTEIDPQLKGLEGVIPTMENSVPIVSRGAWAGHIYTNQTLGLKITALSHYHIIPDDYIARATGVPLSFFDEEFISNDLWIKVKQLEHSVACMGIGNSSTNAFVNLFVQRVPLGIREFPLTKYLQNSLDRQKMAGEQGGVDVQIIAVPEVVEISGHQWKSGRVVMSAPGIYTRTDVFMTIVENNIWIMFIGSSDDYELQEILSMFSTANP